MRYGLTIYIVVLLLFPAAIALSGTQAVFLQDSLALAQAPADIHQLLGVLNQNAADLSEEPALAAALQEKAASWGVSLADYPAIQLPRQPSPSPVRWPLIIGISLVLLSIIGIELYRMFHAAPDTSGTIPLPGELLTYLQNGISQGYAPQELKAALLRSGWDQETVDAALRSIGKGNIN